MRLLALLLVLLGLSWQPALADDDDEYCDRPSGFCPGDPVERARQQVREAKEDYPNSYVTPDHHRKKTR